MLRNSNFLDKQKKKNTNTGNETNQIETAIINSLLLSRFEKKSRAHFMSHHDQFSR